MRIRGLHNAANALAALALGEALGLPLPAMLAELEAFTGLPHRTQWVAEVAGVTYIDDSKGTNVGATIAAVAGMEGPLVIIAGGDGKNQDFAPLAAAFRGKVRHTVLIGRDGRLVGEALRGVCTTEYCASLEEAVRAAAVAARRRRHRVAFARLREPGHVPRLHPSRRGIRASGAGVGGMSGMEETLRAPLSHAARARAPARLAVHIDGTTLALVLGLLLFGLVMVTSASISIASRDTGNPFYYRRAADTDRARGHGRGGARVLLQDGALGAPRAGAPRRRARHAARRARARPRRGGERRPALAAARGRQLPGVGARPRAGVDLHRKLRGAASG